MRVTSLTVRDFRNYERARLDLSEGLTVFAGPNGAGKTNLLEAIYFGLTGRSCRTSNERELPRFGQPAARVEVEVGADDGASPPGSRPRAGHREEDAGRRRAGRTNGERAGQTAGRRVPARTGWSSSRAPRPAAARTWTSSSPRSGPRGPTAAPRTRAPSPSATRSSARIRAGAARAELLDTWDAELARHGMQLMRDREEALQLVEPAFTARAADLGLPEPCVLRYQPRSKADDAEGLAAELRERRQSDIDRGFTQHGPHRDDLALIHGDRPAAHARVAGTAARRPAGAPVRRARRPGRARAPVADAARRRDVGARRDPPRPPGRARARRRPDGHHDDRRRPRARAPTPKTCTSSRYSTAP